MDLDYEYKIEEKENCWYKSICDGSRCGENFCIRHYKMDSLINMATMEGKQKYPIKLKLDSDGTDKEAYDKLKEIQSDINNFVKQGKNLLIYSEHTGNGKTEWAKKLIFSWFNSIWATTDFVCRGLFISLPKFMNARQSNINTPNDYFRYVDSNIVTADLVVWDEINYKDYSDFEHSYLLDIISQRIALGKSNIFTTNYGLKTIEQKLGTRLSSRIIGTSTKVEFKGKDKRSWGI